MLVKGATGIYWFYQYPSGLIQWHWGNHTDSHTIARYRWKAENMHISWDLLYTKTDKALIQYKDDLLPV